MRGALDEPITMMLTSGIIPAYAGSTQCRFWRRLRVRDHPRVCGEHNSITASRGITSGSSPRMRGALAAPIRISPCFGIIPAYAGSTRCHCQRYHQNRDHPRVCGEHFERGNSIWTSWGSSPRMRGARSFGVAPEGLDGIIPAYAGSTTNTTRESIPLRDHPRVCGEHFTALCPLGRSPGSSPRMRGAH